MSRTLDAQSLQTASLFETLTQTRVKDCFREDDSVVFVVMPGYIAQAIGRRGINVDRMRNLLKREVKIVEFNDDVVLFVKNIINLPVHIVLEGKKIVVECPDVKTKGLVYGRDRERLKRLTSLVKRYFLVDEIVVA